MKSKQLTHSLLAKIIAYFLLVIFAAIAMASVIGGMIMLDRQFYTLSKEEIKELVFYNNADNDGRYVLSHTLYGDSDIVDDYCKNSNFSFEIFAGAGKKTIIAGKSYDEGALIKSNYNGQVTKYSYEMIYRARDVNSALTTFIEEAAPASFSVSNDYMVKTYIDDKFTFTDNYSNINKLLDFAYPLRYSIIAIAVISALLAIACFIFLMCAAGHKAGHEEVVKSGVSKIPLDLLTGIMFMVLAFVVSGVLDVLYYGSDVIGFTIALCAFILILLIPFTAYCMILSTNFKAGKWWRSTIVYHAFIYLGRGFTLLGKGMSALVSNLPILWKAAFVIFTITIVELFIYLIFCWEFELILSFWTIEKIILIPLILYVVLILKRLQEGGEKLAAGDLSYQVDTNKMFWDLKEHGKNLNSIAEGMTFAVEERMKSERFKTELITNVSHDIKTPLTSIINYVDLISKEKSDNEKISEYSEVLLRHSERLKKLIEDLVEASKASTGNIDVILAPCEIGVLLTQTVGEYEQKLQNGNLELIVKQPDTAIKIMADGRHLWRIFDNLMNNICKYSQGGTRVYLSVECDAQEAIISFKNTSRYPLDIPEGTLVERFTRGDASRNTEGSGLGLSIAKSLTELQGGKLELTVDGDLFKVILKFKLIN